MKTYIITEAQKNLIINTLADSDLKARSFVQINNLLAQLPEEGENAKKGNDD
jgi:hypothetical protein